MKFLWDVFVALIVSLEGSALVGVVAYGAFILMGRKWATVAAVVCAIVFAVLALRFLYCRSMRREMRWAICGYEYRMLQQSNFSESVLLLNRKDRSALEMFKGFKLRNWERFFWCLLVAWFNFGLFIALFAVCLGAAQSPDVTSGLRTVLAIFAIFSFFTSFLVFFAPFSSSCKSLRQAKWETLIGLDDYRAKRVDTPTVKAASPARCNERP